MFVLAVGGKRVRWPFFFMPAVGWETASLDLLTLLATAAAPRRPRAADGCQQGWRDHVRVERHVLGVGEHHRAVSDGVRRQGVRACESVGVSEACSERSEEEEADEDCRSVVGPLRS